MELFLHEFDLPLKHPFTIARGTITTQPTLIVELRQDGKSGFGEATINTFYASSMLRMKERFKQMQAEVSSFSLGDPSEFWSLCNKHLNDAPFMLSALDCAAHDLWGKLEDLPVHQLWELDLTNAVNSSFTIGIDDIETMRSKLKEESGWPVYKIKLGTKEDAQIVQALRQDTEALFRVDANCGWKVDEAIALSSELSRQGVEFIEQPLTPEKNDAQGRLFHESVLPLVADESCVAEQDVMQCVGRFHGVNIKLSKCGGLTPARRMINVARDHGLKVMVGCMTESSIGISAGSQLAPLIDYADLDGAVLLAEDTANGVKVDRGSLIYPDLPGCGIYDFKG
tara:strand:- start:1055 stop:2074 length:1020 start_codon:yes stop_codon:yes gene_type:complete